MNLSEFVDKKLYELQLKGDLDKMVDALTDQMVSQFTKDYFREKIFNEIVKSLFDGKVYSDGDVLHINFYVSAQIPIE